MRRPIGTFRRGVVVVAVIALVAVGSGALSLALIGDGDDTVDAADVPESTTTTEPASLEELSGPARELAELLARGRTRTYHARYAGSSAGQSEGSIVIESWAKDGRFRQDVRFTVGGIEVERASFVLEDRGVACQRSGEEPWTCSDLPLSQVQGSDPLTGSALAQLKDASVGEQRGEVNDRPARCFTVSYDAQTTEMCVSEAGIPLQIRTQDSRLVVELLEDDVDDGVFEPPAEV